MKLNLLWYLMFIILLGCSNNDKSNYIKIREGVKASQGNSFALDLKKTDYNASWALDSFVRNVEQIEYIKLETSPECYIDEITKIIVSSEDYFIFDGRKSNSVYRFDQNVHSLQILGKQVEGEVNMLKSGILIIPLMTA